MTSSLTTSFTEALSELVRAAQIETWHAAIVCIQQYRVTVANPIILDHLTEIENCLRRQAGNGGNA